VSPTAAIGGHVTIDFVSGRAADGFEPVSSVSTRDFGIKDRLAGESWLAFGAQLQLAGGRTAIKRLAVVVIALFRTLLFAVSADDADRAGASGVFVYFAITIVVFFVADFSAGFDLTDTTAKCAVFAGLNARFADSFSGCSDRTAVTGAGDAIVDTAVAIVVFVVADLGCRFDLLLAEGFALDAGSAPLSAGAFLTGNRTAFSGAGDCIVNTAVAIVIFAVAHFDSRLDLTDATSVDTALAGLSTAFAQPLACGPACSGVTGASQVFIDLAVTVVIFVVAEFFARSASFGIAFNAATVFFADLLTALFASSLSCRAGLALVGKVFVYSTVTVVVFAVTEFFGGFDRSHTGTKARTVVFADLSTVFAQPFSPGSCGAVVTITAVFGIAGCTLLQALLTLFGGFAGGFFGPDNTAEFVFDTGSESSVANALGVFFYTFGGWTGVGSALSFTTDLFGPAGSVFVPLQTTSGVFDALFEGTGDFACFGNTLKFAFFAGSWRTVRNAGFVFALLARFADPCVFAFAPGIVGFAGLCPLFADGGSIRGAGSLTVGFANLATIGDADRFVGVAAGTLFVVFALDTTTLSDTIKTFGAIFVRTTNTTIVFGANLCRRIVVTTLFVFQTSDTTATGSLFQNEATFLTGFAAGDKDRGVSTTTRLKQKAPQQQHNNAGPEYTSHQFHLQHKAICLNLVGLYEADSCGVKERAGSFWFASDHEDGGCKEWNRGC
jgi:hypothetical protein